MARQIATSCRSAIDSFSTFLSGSMRMPTRAMASSAVWRITAAHPEAAAGQVTVDGDVLRHRQVGEQRQVLVDHLYAVITG